MNTSERSQLRAADLLSTSVIGARARPLRAALSALGIALGVAALICVLGITRSSQAGLLNEIDALGTNLLSAADTSSDRGPSQLIASYAPAMTTRIDGVQQVTTLAVLPAIGVYRNRLVPSSHTGGLQVVAVDTQLPSTLHLRTSTGTFLNSATCQYPVVILGDEAAAALGISTLHGNPQVWIGGHSFTVAGILAPVPLVGELDRSALIGIPVAMHLFAYAGHPSQVYVRTAVHRTAYVASVLAATLAPEQPQGIAVNEPTAALTARVAAQSATGFLFLGLGAVALIVGSIGIANTMVIAVLERRSEIGIRRALGATRTHIRMQFLTEATLLSVVGGAAGVIVGYATTLAVAQARHWQLVIPLWDLGTGAAVAILTGAVAGLLPATRAAHVAPGQALQS